MNGGLGGATFRIVALCIRDVLRSSESAREHNATMRNVAPWCALLGLFAAGCGLSEPPPVEGSMARVDDGSELDVLHEEIAFIAPEEWVQSYRPAGSFAGPRSGR